MSQALLERAVDAKEYEELPARARVEKYIAGKGWLNNGKGTERYSVEFEYQNKGRWYWYKTENGLDKDAAERVARNAPKFVKIDGIELSKH